MTKEEADAALAKAIHDHAMVYDLADGEAEFLNDYAFVCHWQKTGEPATEGSRYTIGFHAEAVPTHLARGLFEVGKEMAMGGVRDEED